MLTFTEICLNITQVAGLKKYSPSVNKNVVHVLEDYKILNAKEANTQTYASYSQTATPYTLLKGRKAEHFTIDGVLCKADPTSVATFLATLAAGRNYNTLYNAFLPCSILTCTANDNHTEIPIDSKWMVEKFVISRSVQRRMAILFTLDILKYYQEVPG